MAATSLNNAKAAQFMSRTASYSTHGSRRGYVDDGVPVETSGSESYQALNAQFEAIRIELTALRKSCGVKPGGKTTSWDKSSDPRRRAAYPRARYLAAQYEIVKNKLVALRPAKEKVRLPPRHFEDVMRDTAREMLGDMIWDQVLAEAKKRWARFVMAEEQKERGKY